MRGARIIRPRLGYQVARWVLAGGLVTLAACHSSLPRPAITPGRLSAAAPSCANATLTDLSREPHFDANSLERWKTWDGCELRLDVIMTRHGGCIQGVDDIVFAWPLEVSQKPYGGVRVYTRDPGHNVSEQVPGYLATAPLLPGAVDTGLRQDGRALWLTPSDDRFVWLASDRGVERLPLGVISCA